MVYLKWEKKNCEGDQKKDDTLWDCGRSLSIKDTQYLHEIAVEVCVLDTDLV